MAQSRSPHQASRSAAVVAAVRHSRIRGQSRGKKYIGWTTSSMAQTSGPFSHSRPGGRSEGVFTGRGTKVSIAGSSLKWNSRMAAL
jgi:hypothetical protein